MAVPTRVVLSDLDDTLFDHTYATRTALRALRSDAPSFEAWTDDELHVRHGDILEVLHLDVVAGRLGIDDARIERFRRLLTAAGAERASEYAPAMARRYRQEYQTASQPVAGAIAFLRELKRSGAFVAVVTNNIVVEQRLKLTRCGFDGLVDALITSEEVGVSKPDVEIFQAALDCAAAAPDSAVMVGDAWATDIEGALAAGIRPVWLNRFGKTRPRDVTVAEIQSLEPLEQTMAVVLRDERG